MDVTITNDDVLKIYISVGNRLHVKVCKRLIAAIVSNYPLIYIIA